jgi:hypothetical protein
MKQRERSQEEGMRDSSSVPAPAAVQIVHASADLRVAERSRALHGVMDMQLYRALYLLQRAEQLAAEARSDSAPPCERALAGAHVALAVCSALRGRDRVFGAQHGRVVALTRDEDAPGLLAELCSDVHDDAAFAAHGAASLRDLQSLSSALQVLPSGLCSAGKTPYQKGAKSTLRAALRAAFAIRYSHDPLRVVLFVQPQLADQRVFWDSLNALCLQRLPVLLILDRTRAAAPDADATLLRSIARLGCDVRCAHVSDALAIADATRAVLAEQQDLLRPLLLQLSCARDGDAAAEGAGTDSVSTLRAALFRRGADPHALESLEGEIEDALLAGIGQAHAVRTARERSVLPLACASTSPDCPIEGR